jgi:hypothetical protein
MSEALRKAAKAALEAIERYQVKRQDFDRFADEVTALRAALAEPEQSEPAAVFHRCNNCGHAYEGEPLFALFKEALAWGMVYGPVISPNQWDEMRDTQAQQFALRAAPTLNRGNHW